MKIEVSNGEIVDKLSILEIKLKNIQDEKKRINLKNEYEILLDSVNTFFSTNDPLYIQLQEVNESLWDIEEKLRKLESEKRFDDHFIQLAREVYITNDRRALIKKMINESTGSHLVEEKSYQ
jgi:hypothetical protein